MSAKGKRFLPWLLCVCFCLSLCGCGSRAQERPTETVDPVPVNSRAAEDFSSQNGRVRYPGARLGIDVSAHQRQIDWNAVKADGIDFAIIRLGYRGNTIGGLMLDDYFLANLQGALSAGVEVGVYFFSQAISEDEAAEEAAFVIETLEGYSLAYPVFYDWERADAGRTAQISLVDVTDYARTFCQSVTEAGYEAGVYFNQMYGYSMRLSQLMEYPFWLAEYNDHMSFHYDAQYWQFSCTGRVAGIETDVDMNLYYDSEA